MILYEKKALNFLYIMFDVRFLICRKLENQITEALLEIFRKF